MKARKTCMAVTGGTGFIGRSVVNQLKASGIKVNALCRKPQQLDGVTEVQGDLDDISALEKLAHQADAFIHIAGLTKARSLKELLRVNETGAANAAIAARKAGVRRFILVSSIAAREPHLSNYAKSKHAGEEAVKAQIGGMELVIVRPPAIIGPGDDAIKPMLNILKRGFLPAPAGRVRKSARMSFVYMDDVARFLIEQVEAPVTSPILTPYGGTPEAGWQDLADAASNVLSKPVRVLPIPPIILAAAALISQTISALFLQSGFFNTGKVRELLHSDWRGSTEIANAYTLEDALKLAFELDQNA